MRICCFFCVIMIINEESLYFGLLLGQKKILEDVILGFGKLR